MIKPNKFLKPILIFYLGGTGSIDLDLLGPPGEGDLERRLLRLEKLPL